MPGLDGDDFIPTGIFRRIQTLVGTLENLVNTLTGVAVGHTNTDGGRQYLGGASLD